MTDTYNTTIDTSNVFPGLAGNSEVKWQLAKSLQGKLAEAGTEIDLDMCGVVVSVVLRRVRVIMNIGRPDCLADFAGEIWTAVLSASGTDGNIPMKSQELPMLGVIEAAAHDALATVTNANWSSEAKRREELMQH
ncbi:MAG: hypothetical protein NTY30_00775 [Candidatus Berkelbacteria bacterium]|nr:hypothetical protein [Candidatus Berkelbacteria bacterium]